MNNQVVTVNLIPGLSAPAVVKVSQYDVGRPITFNILDGASAASISSSMTVTVVGTKPSGLGFSQSAVIASLSTVTINTTLAMTQECGMIPAEIRFTQSGENVGTANFILAVEKTPHAEGTTDGTYETMADLETRLQAEIDDLSDRIDDIEAGGSGLSSTEKQLILTLFSKAAYAESDASTAYDALESLWTTTTRSVSYNLTHVTSSNTSASVESGQSYTTTLTADSNYTLNIVTVKMGGVDITSTSYSSGTVSIPSVTGNIVITATAVSAVSSISAVYTQGGTVYTGDALDSLKSDLVVTANYSGGTSATIPSTDYTLSGSLTAGTSVITVSYGGKTTTFNVTVTFGEDLIGAFYTGLSFSTKTDTVTVIYGHSSNEANRMGFAASYGDHAVEKSSGTSDSLAVTLYPISVPTAATKMIFSFNDSNGTPDTSVGMNNYFVKWDSNANTWKRTEDRINYTYGSGEHDIVAADNDGTLYAVFTFRNTANDSAINNVDRSHWILAWR